MGGQQFGSGTVHLDTRSLAEIHEFDGERGLVRAEAGIQWPALIDGIRAAQDEGASRWGIRQKQTGASDLCLGGALSANAHGRGLTMRPFIDDVEAFTLIDHRGRSIQCSRRENPELFRLVIGGYGLFGVIYDITLASIPAASRATMCRCRNSRRDHRSISRRGPTRNAVR